MLTGAHASAVLGEKIFTFEKMIKMMNNYQPKEAYHNSSVDLIARRNYREPKKSHLSL